jgi:Rrf2 family protein
VALYIYRERLPVSLCAQPILNQKVKMKVSAKAEYACLAVLDLAMRHNKSETVQTSELARRNGIPERFLVQILLQLKGAGLVQSVRGAAGGYRLAVAPETISLFDLIRLVDGPNALGEADADTQHDLGRQILHAIWRQATLNEAEHLRQISFQNLADSAAEMQGESMYYI